MSLKRSAADAELGVSYTIVTLQQSTAEARPTLQANLYEGREVAHWIGSVSFGSLEYKLE